ARAQFPLDLQVSCSKIGFKIMKAQYRLIHLALLLSMCWRGYGANGGSIAGLVQDGTGGAVSDAAVIARNLATGVEQKTATNGAGFYAFPSLASGGYAVRAEHAGFRPHLQGGIDVVSGAA